MLDAGAHLRARRIGGLLRLTEFAVAIGPAMNAVLQAALGELFLDVIAAIGAVALRSPFHQAPLDGTFGSLRPHARSRVARIENIFELLTVVHARVAHHVTAHEFVPAVDADMVLEPKYELHASSSSARPCPSGGPWPAWISSLPAFRLP